MSARQRCPACTRPLTHCLCALIPQLESATRLLVIQHPDEQKHALNTARLLVSGLIQAELLVVERLDDPHWIQQLEDPYWRTELLFPGESVPLLGVAVDDLRPRQLVLLDGTWRKARKLLYLNPVLQTLPRVALPQGLQSRYRLRKAPMPGALSTIEAGAVALGMLEPERDFSALLRPFEALIDGQITAMGKDCYRRNHTKD